MKHIFPSRTEVEPQGGWVIDDLRLHEIGKDTFGWTDPDTGYEYTMRVSVSKREPKPLYRNKGWLETQYIGHGRTMQSIADQFGLSPMSICKWLHKFNIPTRPRGRSRE